MEPNSVGEKRLISGTRVSIACGVRVKRTTTNRCIPVTRRIGKQRSPPSCGVAARRRISGECLKTIGCILTGGIALERLRAGGRILPACGEH